MVVAIPVERFRNKWLTVRDRFGLKRQETNRLFLRFCLLLD